VARTKDLLVKKDRQALDLAREVKELQELRRSMEQGLHKVR
jgi:hypothetical protein